MAKLVAFGDSFTWGSELSDCIDSWHTSMKDNKSLHRHEHKITLLNKCGPYAEVDHEHKLTTYLKCYSKHTWTALLANMLGNTYICYASPGASNQTISRKLMQFLPFINNDDYVIINWTYIDRWEFVDIEKLPIDSQWKNITPTSNINSKFEKFYFNFIQNELWNKWNSLKEIMLAINILKAKNIQFLMTCNDTLLLDQKCHAPSYVKNTQNEIKDHIIWFEGMGFNEWVSKYNFPRGKDNNHPLEEAHIAAFNYIKEQNTFNTIKKQRFNIPQKQSHIPWNNTYTDNYTVKIMNYDTK